MTEKAREEEKIKPFADKVFCKRVERESNIIGGIIIPESSQKKPREAIVIAVGDGTLTLYGELIALRCKPGMKVVLPEFGGTEFPIGDENYIIVHEHELLCTIG